MEEIKLYLEVIYYISAIILMIVAVLGLKQLKLTAEQTKETINNRKLESKRESFKLAAEQNIYFADTIIPLFKKIDDTIKEKKIPYYNETDISISDTVIEYHSKDKDFNLDDFITYCGNDTVKLLNCLESLSVYYITGLASDDVGYRTIGNSYTNFIKRYLPIVCDSNENGSYNHILKLFILWDKRLTEDKDKKTLEKLTKKISKNKSYKITSIGT